MLLFKQGSKETESFVTSIKDPRSTETQEKRKEALYRFCQHATPLVGRIRYDEGFLYNDEHRIIYCRVPKVACSTWKRVLLIFEGAQKTLFEKHMREARYFKFHGIH